MNRGIGRQPVPPPKPVWEWWRYPASWIVLAWLGATLVASAIYSLVWLIPAAVMASAIALAWSLNRNDTR
jgi:hypothetical protein